MGSRARTVADSAPAVRQLVYGSALLARLSEVTCTPHSYHLWKLGSLSNGVKYINIPPFGVFSALQDGPIASASHRGNVTFRMFDPSPIGFRMPTGTTVQNLTHGQKGTHKFQMRIARYG